MTTEVASTSAPEKVKDDVPTSDLWNLFLSRLKAHADWGCTWDEIRYIQVNEFDELMRILQFTGSQIPRIRTIWYTEHWATPPSSNIEMPASEEKCGVLSTDPTHSPTTLKKPLIEGDLINVDCREPNSYDLEISPHKYHSRDDVIHRIARFIEDNPKPELKKRGQISLIVARIACAFDVYGDWYPKCWRIYIRVNPAWDKPQVMLNWV